MEAAGSDGQYRNDADFKIVRTEDKGDRGSCEGSGAGFLGMVIERRNTKHEMGGRTSAVRKGTVLSGAEAVLCGTGCTDIKTCKSGCAARAVTRTRANMEDDDRGTQRVLQKTNVICNT